MTFPALIHGLLVFADSLDATTDELPAVCEQQRLTLSALARAAELTAKRLQREQAERELEAA